jgi:hypothetical protein
MCGDVILDARPCLPWSIQRHLTLRHMTRVWIGVDEGPTEQVIVQRNAVFERIAGGYGAIVDSQLFPAPLTVLPDPVSGKRCVD